MTCKNLNRDLVLMSRGLLRPEVRVKTGPEPVSMMTSIRRGVQPTGHREQMSTVGHSAGLQPIAAGRVARGVSGRWADQRMHRARDSRAARDGRAHVSGPPAPAMLGYQSVSTNVTFIVTR